MKEIKKPNIFALFMAAIFVLLGMVLCAALAMSGKWAMGLLLLVFSAVVSSFILTYVEEDDA